MYNEDLTNLSFNDNTFDVVTILEVLEHIPNVKKAIKEAIRVSKKFIVITVPSKEDNNPEHIHLLTKTILTDIFNEYGGNIPGAKGVPDEILKEASKLGVSKINVDTDLRLAMTAQIRRVFAEDPSVFDPRKYLGAAKEEIKATVAHKINNVFCSAGKA